MAPSLGETLELFLGAGTWSAAPGTVGFVPAGENWDADKTKDMVDADYLDNVLLPAVTSKRVRAVHIAVECARYSTMMRVLYRTMVQQQSRMIGFAKLC